MCTSPHSHMKTRTNTKNTFRYTWLPFLGFAESCTHDSSESMLFTEKASLWSILFVKVRTKLFWSALFLLPSHANVSHFMINDGTSVKSGHLHFRFDTWLKAMFQFTIDEQFGAIINSWGVPNCIILLAAWAVGGITKFYDDWRAHLQAQLWCHVSQYIHREWLLSEHFVGHVNCSNDFSRIFWFVDRKFNYCFEEEFKKKGGWGVGGGSDLWSNKTTWHSRQNCKCLLHLFFVFSAFSASNSAINLASFSVAFCPSCFDSIVSCFDSIVSCFDASNCFSSSDEGMGGVIHEGSKEVTE